MTMVRLQVSSCENDKYIHIDDILLTLNEIITNDKTVVIRVKLFTQRKGSSYELLLCNFMHNTSL